MSRRPVLWTVLAALLVAGALVVARPALSAAAPVRIMPLGDSITAGPGCWRAYLWDHLQRTGYTNIDFVGTQPGGGCSVPFDGDHEGHGGIAATGMANANQLPPWLAAARPDVVLMHLGTNDIWGNPATTTVLAAYSTLVDQMRASNPNMKIIVAQIIPMGPANCTYCASGVVALNNAIPGWAASKSTAQSPIVVVDQWTGFDTVADTSGDGVHPDDSGFQKMADRWYPVLTQVLNGGTASPSPSRSVSPSPSRSASPSVSPSASPSVSPSASPSRSAGGACTAAYRVANQWGGNFQGEVTVKNTGSTASSGWTVTWSFANGQQLSQSWSATVAQSGAAVTARSMSWNGALAPGATTTFGFIASWNNATNAAPTPSCVLG